MTELVLPTTSQINAWHIEWAPNARVRRVVLEHSEIVARIAEATALRNALPVDLKLLQAGIMLHDVGYYRLFDTAGDYIPARGVEHGTLGGAMLRAVGVDEAICRMAERHTGVGITKQEIVERHLAIPPQDYLAKTPEEKILMYVDKFHTKGALDGSRASHFWSAAGYAGWLGAEHGSERAERFMAMVSQYGEPNLDVLAAQYGQWIQLD